MALLTRFTATGLLEFQIPPQVARYASFMFSFVGRGVCTYKCKKEAFGLGKRSEGHTLNILQSTFLSEA